MLSREKYNQYVQDIEEDERTEQEKVEDELWMKNVLPKLGGTPVNEWGMKKSPKKLPKKVREGMN